MTPEPGGEPAALLRALRAGEVAAVDVAGAHLRALRRAHAATNAVAAFDDERALADADRLDRALAAGVAPGRLHGLPVTVKDWIDEEGFPCAGASVDQLDRRPLADATVVARLRRAGVVVLAKTVPWGPQEGAGRVRHPTDPDRSPGGSSTGEAVLVADGASPLGIGSDSGGSIRLPAAWCGVFGLKPTAGLVPTTGHFPRVGALSDGRTQIGPLARSVDLLELVLQVIAGPDGRDAGVSPVPLRHSSEAGLVGARFAVTTGEPPWSTTPELEDAAERAAGALSGAGLVRTGWSAPWLGEALDITRRYWSRAELSGRQAADQLWDWDRFRRRYLQASEHVDLLVTPVTRHTAPRHRAIVADDFVFTLPANLTGSPAVAVPMGPGRAGMPLAVQLVGRPWEDHRVLAAARLVAASGISGSSGSSGSSGA